MTIRSLIGCGLASVLATACVSDEPPTPVETEPAPRGVEADWHLLGAVDIKQVPADFDFHPTVVEAARAGLRSEILTKFEQAKDRFGVMYVDFDKRRELVATYDHAAVAKQASELHALGYGDASDTGGMGGAPRGLSNNIDNRVSFEDWPLTHSTLRKVGRVGGGCTGALFGNRLVLTAAHCIFDGNGNYVQNNTFQARRNGSELPYGTVTSTGAFYPIAYKNDGCNVTYTGACVKNDWAILVLPANPWASSPNGAPGYLGVWWAGDSTLAGFETRNIGYPGCSSAMAPASCVSNVAYGDLTCANVDPALSDPDDRWPNSGMNGKMRTGCDTSGGHSGGPIYSYSPGSNGPYIIGNTVWNQCNTSSCTATTLYSSAGIRISENLAAYMMNLRAQYP